MKEAAFWFCLGLALATIMGILACDASAAVGLAWAEPHGVDGVVISWAFVEIKSVDDEGNATIEIAVGGKALGSGTGFAYYDANGNGQNDEDEPMATPGHPVSVEVPDGTTAGTIVVQGYSGRIVPKGLDFWDDFKK